MEEYGRQNNLSVPTRLTNAEKCRRWRKKKKKTDKNFLIQERERKREARKQRSQEQIEKDNATARIRMRHLRMKNTKEARNSTTKHIILTRKQRDEQREKWRKYKRTYRAKLGPQKKRRIKEKERNYKKETRNTVDSRLAGKDTNKENNISSDGYSNVAKRKAISRIKKRLPKDPLKYATIVKGLIETCRTPRKRKALSDIVLTPSKRRRVDFLEKSFEAYQSTISTLKKSAKRESIKRRRFLTTTFGRTMKKYGKMKESAKNLGVRWATLVKWTRTEDEDEYTKKSRSDALSEEKVQQIKDFFVRPYISVTHAAKKSVTKDLNQRQFLSQSKKKTFQLFKDENSSIKVSESKFWKLKPKHVVPLKKGKLRSCVCEKCVNVELKLKALNSKTKIAIDKFDVNRQTLCHYESGAEPALECINRNCTNCGVQKLNNLEKILSLRDDNITWYQWENTKVRDPTTNKEKTRKILALHSSSTSFLAQELLKELHDFSSHLFFARWQYKQFSSLKENMPESVLVCVMDFAQNFEVRYQDECQSKHWYYEQVTLHPMVCYYKGTSQNTVTQEVVYISDDLNHDVHFVDHCVKDCMQFLQHEKNVEVGKLIQFSDGCASQYKSKYTFMDVSCYIEDLNIDAERTFFGSGHGKGPADGCSGVVKSAVTRAIIGGVVIYSAETFFAYCKQNLEKDDTLFKRNFRFVRRSDVNRDRPDRRDVKTVNGTRTIHSVKPVCPGIVKVRNISCLCDACVSNTPGTECKSKNYTDLWRDEILLKSLNKSKRQLGARKTEIGRKVTKASNSQKTGKKEQSKGENVVKQQVEKKDRELTGGKTGKKQVENVVEQKEKKVTEYPEGKTGKKQVSKLESVVVEQQVENKDTQLTEEKTNNPDLKIENGDNISAIRDEFFDSMLKDFQKSSSYDELQLKCSKYILELEKFDIIGSSEFTVVGTAKKVDKEALKLIPTDAPENRFPVCVEADGNCLPRSGSVLATGKEDHHTEIRARMVLELVMFEEVYLDENYLGKGCLPERKKNILSNFVMYSDNYIAGNKISPAYARRILQDDTMDLVKSGEYVNAWQLFALASVLQCPVNCIYPQKGNELVRKDLNRTLYPRHQATGDMVYLMWSSTRTDEMQQTHWVPNHFVPVLPLSSPSVTDTMIEENPVDEIMETFSFQDLLGLIIDSCENETTFKETCENDTKFENATSKDETELRDKCCEDQTKLKPPNECEATLKLCLGHMLSFLQKPQTKHGG